jgi:hypothetical protein
MLEWWQSALITVPATAMGGIIAWVIAYYTNEWSTSAAGETQERQQRFEQAMREAEAKRQYRREQVNAAVGFLDMAGRYYGSSQASEVFKGVYEDSVKGTGRFSEEQWRQLTAEKFDNEAVKERVTRDFFVAFGQAPTKDIQLALAEVLGVALSGGVKLSESIRHAHALLGEFISGSD